MGKRIKYFKSNYEYIKGFIITLIFFIGVTWILIDGLLSTEEELKELFGNQKLIGDASQRGAQIIEMILINRFGKIGLMLVPILGLLGITHILVKDAREYKRFRKRTKLFKEGYVKDMIDDYVPRNIFLRIIDLFRRKETFKIKRKGFSFKERKKIKNDKLYKKMYGKKE